MHWAGPHKFVENSRGNYARETENGIEIRATLGGNLALLFNCFARITYGRRGVG
jgi:hypothetical protein